MIVSTFRNTLLQTLTAAVPEILAVQDKTGRFGDEPWICHDQHRIYPLAAAWALDDAENPYRHSPALLEAIMAGGDVLIEEADENGMWTFRKKDHSTWGQIYMPWTYSRWIRTFALVRDAMPADRRARWEAALQTGYDGIARTCLGGVHNIPAHHAMGLYCAGVVFDRAEWREQARGFMARVVAAQTPDGWWSEHAGPVVKYNFVYTDSLGVYYALSKDPLVLEALRRAAGFHALLTYPDGSAVETVDERNVYTADVAPGNVGFSFTPEGRGYLAAQGARLARAGRPFDADFAATLLLYGEFGDALPTVAEQARCRRVLGRDDALVERRQPWFTCLSAFTAMPPENRWIQDRQNYLSLYHDRLGVFLGGGNTKLQPLLGTFTVGDTALLRHTPGDEDPVFVPDIDLQWYATAATLLDDAEAPGLALTYGEESRTIRVQIVDDARARITVEATCRSGRPVEAHLPLLRRGDEVTAASGLRATLGEQPVSWTAEEAGGHIHHAGLDITLPPGSRLTWPVLPHNPYVKDGHSGPADGWLVLCLPLTPDHPRAEVELKVR